MIDAKTANNYTDLSTSHPGGNVYSVHVPLAEWGYGEDCTPLPANLPECWSRERDRILRRTIRADDLWAQSVNIAITISASWGWQIDGDIPLRVKRAQQLFLAFDTQGYADGVPWGKGWTHGIVRHLRDYLLSDNGAFVRVIRAKAGYGSRIIGLQHLSSARCTRTDDPMMPVVYEAPDGVMYGLRPHQVFMLSDMTDSEESANGVGFCAASRAWKTIRNMAAISDYMHGKISGTKPLAIDYIKGVAPGMSQVAVQQAKGEIDAKSGHMSSAFSATAYMGAVIAEILGDVPLEHVRINLADLPENFDLEQERSHALLAYANALGLDPQDLQPLSGQALGTGAQSRILDDKGDTKGLELWRKGFEHACNMWVLDTATTFTFTSNDDARKIAESTLGKSEAERLKAYVDAGILTPQQGLQVAVDADQLPRELLPEDLTVHESLADDEAADHEHQTQEESTQNGVEDPTQNGVDDEQEKALSNRAAIARANALIDEQIERAERIAAQALRTAGQDGNDDNDTDTTGGGGSDTG